MKISTALSDEELMRMARNLRKRCRLQRQCSDGANEEQIRMMQSLDSDRMMKLNVCVLRRPRRRPRFTTAVAGDAFERLVTVLAFQHAYYLKSNLHLVDDKMHACSTGSACLKYSAPFLGGKARLAVTFRRNGSVVLEAYGAAAYVSQEMLTVKSDDVNGRTPKMYETSLWRTLKIEAGRNSSTCQ